MLLPVKEVTEIQKELKLNTDCGRQREQRWWINTVLEAVRHWREERQGSFSLPAQPQPEESQKWGFPAVSHV